MWHRGKTREPPIEALILAAARDWSVPPWTILDDCMEEWWEWFVADYDARAEAKPTT